MSRYHETYRAWENDPHGFWLEAARAIDWAEPPQRAFDGEAGLYGRWFPDASGNVCHNCVDRHAARVPEQTALIYDSPVTGRKSRFTFAELKEHVEALAALIRAQGVERGDRVIVYMPMVPEAVFAMLACARIGAVHSVVFGGFASAELATRIDDAAPKLIVSASCGLEPGRTVEYKPLLDGAIAMARHKVERTIVLQRPEHPCDLVPGRDVDYAEAVAKHRGESVPCVPVRATDPLYVLYTSGTTGAPKGIVRDTGGHMVALHWSMRNVYGVAPGETFWTASDVGWVVGHSYIVYAPLLAGNTTVLFEGKPTFGRGGAPDPGTFWRVMGEHGAAAFFTAPTAFRAVRAQDPDGEHARRHDLSRLRTIFLAGERADPATVRWLEGVSGKPVVDHWWQTETGWPICSHPVGPESVSMGALPVRHGSPGLPMPGWDMRVLSDEGEPVEPGTLGNLVARLPLPPGAAPTLWNADGRFRSAYLDAFPGHYNTSDAGTIDADGYVFVMARTDDIINVAGHRLSTGAMEEVIGSHPRVVECAVIGIADPLKGQLPAGLMVLRSGSDPAAVEREVIALVRERIGPVAAFKTALAVARLPKTRSGKILRATVGKIADGEDHAVPATIDDPAILQEIAAVLRERGVGQAFNEGAFGEKAFGEGASA